MTHDAFDNIDTTAERKPWTTPMVIVAELHDTSAKGTTVGDFVAPGPESSGS